MTVFYEMYKFVGVVSLEQRRSLYDKIFFSNHKITSNYPA